MGEKQVRRSMRSTTVDQWGWDSKKMWLDIISDDALYIWLLNIGFYL